MVFFLGFSLKPTSRRHFATDHFQGVNTQMPTGKSFWMRLAKACHGRYSYVAEHHPLCAKKEPRFRTPKP